MHKYRVSQRWQEESRLALWCSAGRYHLARALGPLPAANAILEGARPHLGFGTLQCTATGTVFRVIFESIDNTEKPLPPSDLPTAAHKPHSASFGVLGRAY